tara:strand:+ start:154 stop:483 length:330 start_codon:yes stop_codon:yes gene_type:complete
MHNTNENQIDQDVDANEDDRPQTPTRRPNVGIRSRVVTAPRRGLMPTSMWSQAELDGDEIASVNTDEDVSYVSSEEVIAMETDSEEEDELDIVAMEEDDDPRFTRNFPR